MCAIEPLESDAGDLEPRRSGSYRMHTRAVEKPTRMNSMGTRNASRCTRLCSSTPVTRCLMMVGGMQIAAIMDAKRQMAKKMTRVSRILAMSLYLRKYLRRVMSAAR